MSQASNKALRGSKGATSGNTSENAIEFFIERWAKSNIKTGNLVRVEAVHPGATGPVGFCDIKPLVAGVDGAGNSIPPQTIYNVPYSRIQGGVAALIIDPVAGDIGAALFCQRDISSAKANKGPANPGSFRFFDEADALYIGGFLNEAPEIYLELTQELEAVLHAPVKVTVNTTNAIINASELMEVNSPLTVFNGAVEARDGFRGKGKTRAKIAYGLDVEDGITNTGSTISSNDFVLDDHTHNGVQEGSGNTGGPNR